MTATTIEAAEPRAIDYAGAWQFDFARNWKRKVAPLLDDPDVVRALTVGLRLYDTDYKEGDPPFIYGAISNNEGRQKPDCLSWYQPWGRCHFIAPFCWALGRKLWPRHQWGFITSDRHTVVIGYIGDWREPEVVMDILLFRKKTARESIEFAMGHGWKFYRSLAQYAASFYFDLEGTFEVFRKDMPS